MQNSGATATQPGSDLAVFVQGLMDSGRAAVAAKPSEADDSDAVPLLEKLDQVAREELALDLPAFSPVSALWAARLLCQLGRFILCREIPAEAIPAACQVPCPEKRCPETDWSADLTLRHLPRLLELARHLSNGDPLVEQIKLVATAWPLSSVGIAGLGNLQLDSFIDHPALCRLYADRILAAADLSRLGDARVDGRLRADIGIHRDLSPVMAQKLLETPYEPH